MLYRLIFSISCMLVVTAAAHADGLFAAYQQAENSDPQYLQQVSAYRASLENRPQALSNLLPTVSISANTSRNDQEIKIDGGRAIGSSGGVEFSNRGYSLDLRQTIFRRDRFLSLDQADDVIMQAEAELGAAQQDLMIRISEAYFSILTAQDELEFARLEKKSLARQLDQAEQRFDVGLVAITDVQEAKAGHDLAVARRIRAENQLDNAYEAMREITGAYLPTMNPLVDETPLLRPQPENIDEWSSTAAEQNLDVIAARHATEVSRKAIKIQRSGHMPTLDLVASHGYNKSGGRFGGTRIRANQIGLEFALPIDVGGGVRSRTRQAIHENEQSMQQLESTIRSAQRSTREAYLGVLAGISEVQALNQAVVSSETALEATEAGFEVGTRTAVDVVAAERSLNQAQRDYSNARYEYLLNTLRLKRSAGTLAIEDLQSIDKWLN